MVNSYVDKRHEAMCFNGDTAVVDLFQYKVQVRAKERKNERGGERKNERERERDVAFSL